MAVDFYRVLSFANKDTQKPEFVAIKPRHVVPTIFGKTFPPHWK
jgi:hypothetical protein